MSNSESQVLDQLFAKPEQSYEDFLESFTQLKKSDLLKATVKKVEKSFENCDAALVEEPREQYSATSEPQPCTDGAEEPSEMELPPGNQQLDYLSRDKEIPLKYGNFVEDEQDADLEGGEAYVPKFGLTLPDTQLPATSVNDEQTQQESTDEGTAHESCAAERHSVSIEEEGTSCATEDDLLGLLPENTGPQICSSALLAEVAPVALPERPPHELPTHPQLVSLGNVDARSFLYPGEAEPDHETPLPADEHVTRLDVRTRCNISSVAPEMESDRDDGVTTFSLDENFDYDNVKLSSKFQTDDWNTMKAVAKS